MFYYLKKHILAFVLFVPSLLFAFGSASAQYDYYGTGQEQYSDDEEMYLNNDATFIEQDYGSYYSNTPQMDTTSTADYFLYEDNIQPMPETVNVEAINTSSTQVELKRTLDEEEALQAAKDDLFSSGLLQEHNVSEQHVTSAKISEINNSSTKKVFKGIVYKVQLVIQYSYSSAVIAYDGQFAVIRDLSVGTFRASDPPTPLPQLKSAIKENFRIKSRADAEIFQSAIEDLGVMSYTSLSQNGSQWLIVETSLGSTLTLTIDVDSSGKVISIESKYNMNP